ncbi:mRNA cap guanine-N7 methyltransferase [Leucoagaricus sp. SymC.cos]|nr:mRNA cap guanine-N7 methyltransferase [Leucoagaricus sp. SymC.cos]
MPYDPVRDAVRNSPVEQTHSPVFARRPRSPLHSPSLTRRATDISMLLNTDSAPPPHRTQPSTLSHILHGEDDKLAAASPFRRFAYPPDPLRSPSPNHLFPDSPRSRPSSSSSHAPPSTARNTTSPMLSPRIPPTLPYNPKKRITPAGSVLIPLSPVEVQMYKNYCGKGAARLKKRKRAASDDPELPPGKRHAGDVGLVVNHYNSRPDVGVVQRQESPIIGLKNFNNWVKSVLITKFAHPALAKSTHVQGRLSGKVLDMGCGKGGDITKWSKAKIRELLGVDIAAVSIEQARERWYAQKGGVKFDATFAALDAYSESISRAFPPAKLVQPFDVVSMQFCMHYAFETVQKARCMLENVTRYLRPGGIFIGTIPNSEFLLEQLSNIPAGQQDLSFGNDVYMIRFEERDKQPVFGHKYTFFLRDAVENVPEYVVRWENFRRMAEDYKLQLLYKKDFHDVFMEHQEDQEFGQLLVKMKVVDANGESSMDEAQWEAARSMEEMYSQTSAGGSGGIFHSAHHFTVAHSTLVDQQVSLNYNNDNTMRELLAYTIRGAELDSSERDPPPHCHPGTRVSILEDAKRFFQDPEPLNKVLWLCGPAGVGKSAIVQTIAESLNESTSEADPRFGAAVFFSRPNRRDNPKHVFTTIAYQLSVRYPFYRQYIAAGLANDPLFLDKSMSEQFKRLIVQPFTNQHLYRGPKPLVILLDGLDECDGDREQMNIVLLICRFVLQHPDVPLLWVIASRPEPHIRDTFHRPDISTAFTKVNVPIDSDEACKDVEKYLRKAFEEIKQNYPECFSETVQWPTETQILAICAAVLGLFAFAETVRRFVEDTEHGDPITQLEEVLTVIKKTHEQGDKSSRNPLATLDALYIRVLSSVPEDLYPTTVQILYEVCGQGQLSFPLVANFLGLAQNKAYSALRKLHSLLSIPSPKDVEHDNVSVYHASFTDFVWDSSRSEFDLDIIDLSWPLENAKETRRGLLVEACKEIGPYLPEIMQQPPPLSLRTLIEIFKKLDIMKLTLLDDSDFDFFYFFLRYVQKFARPRKVPETELTSLIPMGKLDRSSVDMEAPAYVHCLEKYPYDGSDLSDHIQGDTVKIRGLMLKKLNGRYRMDPMPGMEGYVEYGYVDSGALNEENMRPLLTDFDDLRVREPSKEVIIWGNGKKRVIMLRQQFRDDTESGPIKQKLFYLIPYPETS